MTRLQLCRLVSNIVCMESMGSSSQVPSDNENRNSPDPATQQYFADLEEQYRDGNIDILL